jgi:alcohol dehydrogenase
MIFVPKMPALMGDEDHKEMPKLTNAIGTATHPAHAGFGIQRAPSLILFGAGQHKAAPQAALRLGKRIFVCTDARVGAEPFFAGILAELRRLGATVEVFDQVLPEVPADLVEGMVDGVSRFAPDVLMAIGGGSCLDHTKALNILLTHGGRLADYYGENKVPGPVLPLIALPTTAGTGSEVTPVAVISDKNATLKVGISSTHIIPACAICDPELTLTCPPLLTAHTGADALTHAIEAFCAIRRPAETSLGLDRVFVGKNALSDNNALAAVRLISGALGRAVKSPSDLSARADVMQGALLAGLAFGAAGTAAAHAIQYPVGALTGTSHGVGVATLMPHVMVFNRAEIEPQLVEIAHAMRGCPVASIGPAPTAEDAISAVRALFGEIGIPMRLSELGFPKDRLGWAADQAMQARRLIDNNPRPLDAAVLRELMTAAF